MSGDSSRATVDLMDGDLRYFDPDSAPNNDIAFDPTLSDAYTEAASLRNGLRRHRFELRLTGIDIPGLKGFTPNSWLLADGQGDFYGTTS